LLYYQQHSSFVPEFSTVVLFFHRHSSFVSSFLKVTTASLRAAAWDMLSWARGWAKALLGSKFPSNGLRTKGRKTDWLKSIFTIHYSLRLLQPPDSWTPNPESCFPGILPARCSDLGTPADALLRRSS
jgi:hypothetical protein